MFISLCSDVVVYIKYAVNPTPGRVQFREMTRTYVHYASVRKTHRDGRELIRSRFFSGTQVVFVFIFVFSAQGEL